MATAMHEAADGTYPCGSELAIAIEERFDRANGSSNWMRLGPTEMSGYPKRPFSGGWRLSVMFSDGIVRRIDVLVTKLYPVIAPRTALVDRPPMLTWPHVEDDGVLCLLGNSHQIDTSDPLSVLDNIIGRSCRLVDELIEGSIIERDFREEFLTYWAYDLREPHRHYSLLRPEGPTRPIRVWYGKAFTLLAEDDVTIQKWMDNRFTEKKKISTQAGALLWLDPAPLPAEYPHRASDLVAMAKRAGSTAIDALQTTLKPIPSSVTVVLGAEGRAGKGLMAVTVNRPSDNKRTRRLVEPVTKGGFTAAKIPPSLLTERYFGSQPTKRSRVTRADASWIHGRARDPRTEKLRNSKVIIFGCGSVGSFVAATLVRAGVGNMHIVDFDQLEWANVGRHYLGGSSVGMNKAERLAASLNADFPHATIIGHDSSIEITIEQEPDWFATADLVISLTGSGKADNSLNDWHRATGRAIPVVYGWSEPFAGAGHAVAVGRDGGCLSAGVDSLGMAKFVMTTWNSSETLEEPACGVHFAPYGPIELGHVNDLIAELSMDCLLGKIATSTHRIWAARNAHLDEFGGSWSQGGKHVLGAANDGGRTLARVWPSCACCGTVSEVNMVEDLAC